MAAKSLAPRRVPGNESFSVYVISAEGGHQKVGASRDPLSRMRELQGGQATALSLAGAIRVSDRAEAFLVEAEAHGLLGLSRVRGEWFDTTADMALKTIRQARASVRERRRREAKRMSAKEEAERTQLPAPMIDLSKLGVEAAEFARAARSPSTLRSYRSDWADFHTWCESVNLIPIPTEPTTIGLYLAARSGALTVATLRRRLCAISVANKLAGHRVDTRHPAIADVLSGIRRELGSRANSKNAISVEELRQMLRKLPNSITGTRDRAILLIGFAGAFRRSELAALDRSDLGINSRGVAILVRRSKTDQQGLGATIGIPRSRKATCPVAALETWLAAAAITAGPVFRPVSKHGHVSPLRLRDGRIAEVVKRAAGRVGLDPAKYAGHSLRRGFMTAASAAGADLAQIMKQSRHRSTAVAMGYVDEGRIFSNPASRAIGL